MKTIDYKRAYEIAEMVIKNQRVEITELQKRLGKYEPVRGSKEIEFDDAIKQLFTGVK